MSISGRRPLRRGSRLGDGHHRVASALSGAIILCKETPSFRRKPEFRIADAERGSLDPGFRRDDATHAALHPALFGDLAIGLVDGSNLLGSDGDELLRHAAGHQLVGMIVGDETAGLAL